MKKLFASGIVLLIGASALAQSAGTQVKATATQDTSVSASPKGATAESNNSVHTSQQTSVSGPNRRQDSGKENGRQSSGTAASSQLASGTAINVVLTKPLDARKNKQGDPVVARTTATVKSAGGATIPKNSQVLGHVTRARARGKGESESALGIVFERAVLKDGTELPLNVAVQAVAAAQSAAAMQAGDDGMMAGGSAMGAAAGQAGGGLLGGAGAGVLTNTSAGLGSAVGGALGSTTSTAGSLTGELSSNANGVVGMPGMTLQTASSSTADAGVISSTSQNVHLQSGTQMLLMSK